MKHSREDFELKKEYDFSKGIRGRFYRPKKVSTTLRIDDDILVYFKKLASEKKLPYQTLMNTVLRDYTQHH
jgi:predicted DNA binding CopG/RHH family protein